MTVSEEEEGILEVRALFFTLLMLVVTQIYMYFKTYRSIYQKNFNCISI